MKIRIVGTSLEKYINNFMELSQKNIKWFALEKEGERANLISDQEEVVYSFKNNNATSRQNLEAWEMLGLVTNKQFKYFINKSNDVPIMDRVKKGILISSSKKELEFMRMGYLLLIEHSKNKISTKEIKQWKIKQMRGELNAGKLTNAQASYYKKLSKDLIFMAKVRKEIYNEINKEL